jgi:hypothetical protein
MQMPVGTTAVEVDTSSYPDLNEAGQTVLVQNLGPGTLYADFTPNVTVGSGIRLSAGGDALEFRRSSGQKLYVVASEVNTDVRFLAVG